MPPTLSLINIVIWLRLVAARIGDDQCALFRASGYQVITSGQPVYMEIGEVDVGSDFSVEMKIISSRNVRLYGNLFAVGSQTSYPYYAWANWFHSVRFLVLEIVEGSVRLTIKAEDEPDSLHMEIQRHYPVPYSMTDGRFHHVRVLRDGSTWRLSVDNATANMTTPPDFNLQMTRKPAFLGGRPGYTVAQFKGVIRDVIVNNRPIDLRSAERNGNIRVTRCGSGRYQSFLGRLGLGYRPDYSRPSIHVRPITDDDVDQAATSADRWDELFPENNRNQHRPQIIPGIGRR